MVEKMDKNERYKHALKEATKLVASKEMGSREAVKRVNEKFNLNSKMCKRITKSTVNRYVQRGKTGESPLKMGPARKLPPEFNGLLHAHVQMKQLEGVAEAKPKHVKALIGASIRETSYDSMSRDYLYRRFRQQTAPSVAPSKPMQVEDRRGIWTTYGNLNDWYDGAKATLIEYGFAEDKPMRVVDLFKGHEDMMPAGLDSECRH